jgi:hypothetical protein
MRVIVLVKEDPDRDTQPPSTEFFAAMNRFNDELTKAGVMLAADGLLPSDKGKRVRFDGTQRTVIDGPFAEAKELVSGYWIWQVRSLDEAVEWLKRAPFEDGTVEIRPIQEPEDYPAELTDELKRHEERQRAETAARQS